MSQSHASAGPLSGVRVVDMTSLISGPFCTQILSDLGAEVIRIETAGSDVMRHVAPIHGTIGAYFEQVNRGKKSIELNVKSERDIEKLKQLIAVSDVFVQNSRPGVMEKLGLGYETVSRLNPRIVYTSINGFGETGSMSSRPAYDTVIQGIVGFMPVQGAGDGAVAVRGPVADKSTGMWAAHATLAALFYRERSGEGQKVVVNMTAAYSAFSLLDLMHGETFTALGGPREPPTVGAFQTLSTSDGEVIGLVLQPHQFQRFVTVLGRADLIGDERFATSAAILDNTGELYGEVSEVIAKLTTEDFIKKMDAESIPFGKVNNVPEFIDSEEARSANAFVEFEDAELGRVRHLNFPGAFSRSPVDVRRRAPKLGENTREILDMLSDVEPKD